MEGGRQIFHITRQSNISTSDQSNLTRPKSPQSYPTTFPWTKYCREQIHLTRIKVCIFFTTIFITLFAKSLSPLENEGRSIATTRQWHLAKLQRLTNFSVRNYCKSRQFERCCQLERAGDESQNLFGTSWHIDRKPVRKRTDLKQEWLCSKSKGHFL